MKKVYTTLGIVLASLFIVTAGLVAIYSQKQVNLEVESPIVLNGDLVENVNVIAGDGYRLFLVEGENKLDRNVLVNAQVNLLDGNGDVVTDTSGFYLAFSEDIQYAYNVGGATTWEEAQTWMFDNLDWFDWYLTGDLVDFDSSVITNFNNDSAYEDAIAFNSPIPQEIEPGNFYAVIYMDVNEAVIPDSYTLNIDIEPA